MTKLTVEFQITKDPTDGWRIVRGFVKFQPPIMFSPEKPAGWEIFSYREVVPTYGEVKTYSFSEGPPNLQGSEVITVSKMETLDVFVRLPIFIHKETVLRLLDVGRIYDEIFQLVDYELRRPYPNIITSIYAGDGRLYVKDKFGEGHRLPANVTVTVNVHPMIQQVTDRMNRRVETCLYFYIVITLTANIDFTEFKEKGMWEDVHRVVQKLSSNAEYPLIGKKSKVERRITEQVANRVRRLLGRTTSEIQGTYDISFGGRFLYLNVRSIEEISFEFDEIAPVVQALLERHVLPILLRKVKDIGRKRSFTVDLTPEEKRDFLAYIRGVFTVGLTDELAGRLPNLSEILTVLSSEDTQVQMVVVTLV